MIVWLRFVFLLAISSDEECLKNFSKSCCLTESTSKVAYRRAGRQFGFFLNSSEHIDSGIGRSLAVNPSSRFRMVEASQTFDTEKQYDIAGLFCGEVYERALCFRIFVVCVCFLCLQTMGGDDG